MARARSRPLNFLIETVRGVLAVGVLLSLSYGLYTLLETVGV